MLLGEDVVSWQGVRRDESLNRRFLIERELKSIDKVTGAELWNYRPILDWTAEDAFAMHRKHNIKHNPLYEMGMGRVGCMPCINCRKDELLEISKRFPEAIDRIREWEAAVLAASKPGGPPSLLRPMSEKTYQSSNALHWQTSTKWSSGRKQNVEEKSLTCSACWMMALCVRLSMVYVNKGNTMTHILIPRETLQQVLDALVNCTADFDYLQPAHIKVAKDVDDALAAPREPQPLPTNVWAATSKTMLVLFWNEKDALALAPTATSPFYIHKVPVFGAAEYQVPEAHHNIRSKE
jgi:hypothetical protein